MNLNEVRAAIRQVIAEEMKKGGLPKSGGKLVHLKKETYTTFTSANYNYDYLGYFPNMNRLSQ